MNFRPYSPIETPLQSSQRQDLKKFKVIDVKGSVMHVMDVKTKQSYIIKVFTDFPEQAVFDLVIFMRFHSIFSVN